MRIVKGNIILRSGIDREDYIKACYSTNTVDILTDDGGQISIKYPFYVFHGRNDGIICDLYFCKKWNDYKEVKIEKNRKINEIMKKDMKNEINLLRM